MSRFSTELRYPIEQYQDEHHLNRRTYTAAIYKLIGLDEYPIFAESYRKKLNDKIIEHYYFKEIGCETLARFRWYMRTKMNEVMPKFNVMYEAQNSIVDPLTNRNLGYDEIWHIDEDGGTDTLRDGYNGYGRTEHRENGGKDTQLAGATKEKVVHSETPMNEISTQAVENGNYATDVTYTWREGERAGESVYGGTTDIETGGRDTSGSDTKYMRGLDTDGTKRHNDIGYDGVSPTALLAELSEKFSNIDLMVIESLGDLFMGLWE